MSGDEEERPPSSDVDARARKWPGIAAVALFVVLAAVFVGAPFGDPAPGFEGDAGIMASIGYSMFNIDAPNAVPSEGFLVTFILIAVVLDAALDGAVMLASREDEGELTTALRSEGERVPATDGGRPAEPTPTDDEEVDD
ncbi:NADH-quinone oxidoreductase subunit J [Halorussus halobius]|uniref:NADH-quinone oxidoreductase subunit J n=1 Tax=Halorussus halobius TaxID=1710537 RepID=UPI001FCEDA95|nr:NADH-quinone oxidoreductase subunit J [Halorussus halobius]